MKNRILVIFEIYTLIIIVLLASSVSTAKKETKIDNESINKNIDLIAKAKKEEEFIQNDIYTPIDYFNGFSMYGSLTTLVLLMFWLYFVMYIVLIGLELNDWLARRKYLTLPDSVV